MSDLTTVTQLSDLALAPFDPVTVDRHFKTLEAEATENLKGGGGRRGEITLQRIVELRYKGQVHQVDTPVGGGTVTAKTLDAAIEEFESRYERLYGRGSGFREAGIELVTYRVLGTAHIQDASLQEQAARERDAAAARIGSENLYWREIDQVVETDIYGSKIAPGMALDGPAVIRFEATTALVHPGQRARIDAYGNVRITNTGAGT